jgi:hypothetical protein
MPKHPSSKRISQEFNAILRAKKDIQKNVNASLAWMKEQEDFKDQVQVYMCQYFLYDPSSKSFRDAT